MDFDPVLWTRAAIYSSLNVVAGLATEALNIVLLVVEIPIINMNNPQKATVIKPTSML